MAYEAHKWKIGEEITSDKLNHIEKGIEEAGLPREITDPQDGQILKYDAASGKWVNGQGGGSGTLVVTATDDNDVSTLDHTWQEISDAFPKVELVSADGEREFIIKADIVGNDYAVVVMSAGGSEAIIYSTDSPTGYPTLGSGGGDPIPTPGSDPIG